MELGTPSWVSAAMQALNESQEYHERAAGWRWLLGIGFVDPAHAERDRFAVLDLHDGQCRAATMADRTAFEQAPFRLVATYQQWDRLLHRRADPMRCILLKGLRFEGDRLTALRYLPAAKAMVDALATIEVDIQVA